MKVSNIFHFDLDAFFASVEQRDNSEYRGVPIAVGSDGPRSVLATASYEARRFGVGSAMSGSLAKRMCPGLVFVKPRMDVYRQVSNDVFDFISSFDKGIVDQVSIDEGYVLFNDNSSLNQLFCKRMLAGIKDEFSLPVSGGLSPSRLVSKMATDFCKPEGFLHVPSDSVVSFLSDKPVGAVPGVGGATAESLANARVFVVSDVLEKSFESLELHVGSRVSSWLISVAKGDYESSFERNVVSKSVSSERTLDTDFYSPEALFPVLEDLSKELEVRLTKADGYAYSMTLKLRWNDLSLLTRSKTFAHPFDSAGSISDAAGELLQTVAFVKGARLIGVSLSKFLPFYQQTLGFEGSELPVSFTHPAFGVGFVRSYDDQLVIVGFPAGIKTLSKQWIVDNGFLTAAHFEN